MSRAYRYLRCNTDSLAAHIDMKYVYDERHAIVR